MKYATYQGADNSNYDLSVVVEGDSKGSVYMDIKDDGKSSMGFKTKEDINGFLTFLAQSKAKYTECRRVL